MTRLPLITHIRAVNQRCSAENCSLHGGVITGRLPVGLKPHPWRTLNQIVNGSKGELIQPSKGEIDRALTGRCTSRTSIRSKCAELKVRSRTQIEV